MRLALDERAAPDPVSGAAQAKNPAGTSNMHGTPSPTPSKELSLESDAYGPEILRIHAEILAGDPHTHPGAQTLLDEGFRLAAEQGADRFASRLRAAQLHVDPLVHASAPD